MTHRVNIVATAILSLLLLAAFLHCAGITPAASFNWERIVVTVRPASVIVDGLYSYRNPLPFPISQGLTVPIAHGPEQTLPATIDARLVAAQLPHTSTPLRVFWVGERPHISVNIPARTSVLVNVRFEQIVTHRRAAYLLTSTQAWRKPLEFAEYVLRPKGVEILSSNYPAASDCLCFTKRDFMPTEDWTFTWIPK